MDNARVTADHIVQLGKAFRASKALFSAVELGVFSALAKGPRDLEALRIEVGVSERGARDFFNSLVALKLLEGTEPAVTATRPRPTCTSIARSRPISAENSITSTSAAIRTGIP